MKLKLSALLLTVFCIMLIAVGCGSSGLQVGDTHPGFSLKGIDSNSYSLKEFLNRKVLLIYVAKDCEGCEIEMPFVEAASKNMQNNVKVVIVFGKDKDVIKITDFVNAKKWTLSPILIDEGDNDFKSYKLADNRPINVLLSSEGVIQKIKIGPFSNKDDVESWVK